MEVYATFTKKAEIDPLDVIAALKENFLGDYHNWIIEEDGRYILMCEKSAGTHSYDVEVRKISKDEYDYYQALLKVEFFLNNLKTKL